MYVQDAARFVTEGGVTITASRYGTQSNNSSGKWIVCGKPMTCTGNFDHAWKGLDLDLCVTGNAFKAFRFGCETNARIDCYEDWALNDTNTTVTVTDLNKAADKRRPDQRHLRVVRESGPVQGRSLFHGHARISNDLSPVLQIAE